MQHLTGRVTKDAQVKTFESGRSVVNFNVVQNRYYKNKEGKRIEQAEYFQCSFWRTAKVAPYITKGQIIELFGETSADVFTDREGKQRPVMRLKVDQIVFHSASRKEGDNSTEPVTENADSEHLPF
ncbi:MAG: single-stranded DNA-binding protein [Sphingobacterium sp.]|jgi:single-strand DNA-binding protein|nr:single-stranded DNA-binding protein [Sphingobacterium sp.]